MTLSQQNTEKYVLNLNEKMIDRLITKTEESILEWKIKQEQIEVDLREKERLYLEIKSKYDSFQKEVDEETDILNSLIRYKTSDAKNKTIKVYKSLSNTTHKINKQEQPKRQWIKRIIKVLESTNRFCTVEELYNKIITVTPEWKHNTEFYINKFQKYYLQSGIRDHKWEGLVMYKEKIGLKRWCLELDNELIPDGLHMKEFMYSDNKKNN